MVDDLFVFGDDFEAILGILEEDEALEEEFTAVASDVQSADIICKDCGKKCKSKGGYKRHRAAKHGQDENRVNSDESNTNADKTKKTFILTAVILTKIVLKVLNSVKGNEVFSTSIRNELSSYKHKELEERSTEFSVMKALFEGYAKNGNTEKFYGAYYAQVPLKSTTFFPGLSHNAATLLATKLADGMLSYCNDLKSVTNKSQSSKTALSEKENTGLQYVGGYVLHKLYKKFARKSLPENQQAMAILKAGKLEQDTETQKLVSSLNRGGLWSITQPAQNIFFRTEHYFRQQTSKSGLLKIDIAGITESAIVDSQVISSFQSMVSDAEIVTISNVNKGVLHAIVSLYIRVRSYTFAKDVIQSHKIQSKHAKTKALRKEIIRSYDQDKQDRLG